MNWRQAVLLPAKTYSADATEVIDLNLSEPITDLHIVYKGTNAGSTPTAHPSQLLTKVEIVDGSEIIAALKGQQMVPLHFFHNKKEPLNGINYINDNQCWISGSIPFGRWLYDPMLALDPKRFKNLQARVTIDLNGGGSACDAGSLEVVAHVFSDKKVSPVGFLRNFQWYTYALVSSGYETIELPTDETIRTIMLQSYFPTKATNSQLSEVRIAEDNDRNVVLDNSVSDLLKMLATEYGPYREGFRANTTTSAVVHYFTPCYEEDLVCGNILATPDYFGYTIAYGGKISLDAQTGGEVGGLCWGWSPLGSLWIPTGDPWDLEDWYDPTRLKRLSLRVKGGSSVGASSTAEVVLQTMKKY